MSSVSRLNRVPSHVFAPHKCRRQKVHLQLDRARPLALRTPALRAVEREPARRIAPQPRLRHLGEQPPNLVEKADVRGRNRSRRAANGRLVHFVNGLWIDSKPAEFGTPLRSRRVAGPAFERPLPGRAADTPAPACSCPNRSPRSPAPTAQRKPHGKILQIVAASHHAAPESAAGRTCSGPSAPGLIRTWHLDRTPLPAGRETASCARRHWPVIESGWRISSSSVPPATTSPAMHARARPQVNDVIGAAHRLLVVLDDQQRIAARLAASARAASSCSLSRACRPMVGSSSI